MEPLNHKVVAYKLLLGLNSVVHVILKAVLFILAAVTSIPFVLTFAIMMIVWVGAILLDDVREHYKKRIRVWVYGEAEDFHKYRVNDNVGED